MSLTVFPLKSNKAPACESWQTYSGEANTPMVGVKVPSGVFIIDLDLYKGVTTDAVEGVLGCSLDWESAELQDTLNGGRHYAFACDSELRQGSDLFKIAGFDTRAAGKGYIATGEGYEDLTVFGVIDSLEDPSSLPSLPGEAIKALSVQREPVAVVDDEPCDLMEIVSAQPLGLSRDEMRAYIELLPASASSEQDEWFRVGMAIWHETGGDNTGWELFDAFSRRSPEKYDETRNRRRWESFGNRASDNPVTFASVIKMAGGAEARSRIQVNSLKESMEQADTVESVNAELERMANMKLDNLTLEAMLKKVQSKFKQLRGEAPSIPAIRKELKRLRGDDNTGDYVEDYVFLTATGEYMSRDTKAVMGPRAFDVKHSRETPLNGDGDRQSACQFANDRIDVVENSMYFPKAGEMFAHEGLDYLNEYIPCRVTRVPAGTTNIVARIKGHVAHLLPDVREQDLVINYLAHNVQHPGEKIQWSIVLQGVQGDGKSLLAEMMQHVMGFRNVRIMNVQTLESAFTGWATGQCMTFIEELKLDNKRKYEVLNNLKPYISNPTVEETKKGKDPRTVINTTNYFALTNFQDAIPIDENDRRYCILFSQWQSKARLAEFMEANHDYYPELYEAMRDNAGEILDWLATHPIPKSFKSLKRAPDTNAKERMREMSKSPSMVELEDALERFAFLITEGDEIDVTELGKQVKALQAIGEYDDFPKTSALKNALLTMGYQPSGRLRFGTPYSVEFQSILAERLAELAFPALPPLKGLITDLDDTVWRGIIGEAGIENVSWDLDNQSHLHAVYQQQLRALSERGVLLAIASKNDATVAEAGLARSDMIVEADTFFPREIHWESKSESVTRILQKWNIGADSVLFIDDSAAELAEVQSVHPRIHTRRFPTGNDGDILALVRELGELFARNEISEEDKLRAASIRSSAAGTDAAEKAKSSADPEAFLRQCDARVRICISSEDDTRAFELINKTNQFNLNGIRLTPKEWLDLCNRDDAVILTAEYEDKFGKLGKIAVLTGLRRGDVLEVETWVVSCRAFSRRLEHLCLRVLFDQMAFDSLAFRYRETDRNLPVARFLGEFTGDPLPDEIVLEKSAFLDHCPPLYHSLEFVHDS